MKRIFALIASILTFGAMLMFVSCSSSEEELTVVDSANCVYIALGDSVSSGFGLAGYGIYGVEMHERHSTIFFNELRSNNLAELYVNAAVSGYTTTDVLSLLHNANSELLEYFRNASVITLNIGGNNILTPFIEYLSYMQIADGAENFLEGLQGLLETWQLISQFTGGTETPGLFDMFSGFGGALFGIGDLLMGGSDVLAGMPQAYAILTGNLSPELEAALNYGKQTFNREFNEIINWLETHAPNAVVIVNTVYNPIPAEIMGIPIALSDIADVYITAMNKTIVSEGSARNFIVVDIYEYFSGRLDLMFFNLDPTAAEVSFDLIHPNADGHEFIAQLHYEHFIKHVLRLSE